MIQVGGTTYRIERTAPHRYCVVRLIDDRPIGTFATVPSLRIHPSGVELSVFRDVVRAALRAARTSAVWHAAPVCAPPEEQQAPVAVRTPSSMPPPNPVAV